MREATQLIDAREVEFFRCAGTHCCGERVRCGVQILNLDHSRERAARRALPRLDHAHAVEMRNHIVDLIGIAFAAKRAQPRGAASKRRQPVGERLLGIIDDLVVGST